MTRHAADDDEPPTGGISRRTLVRLLVGLGVGLPITIEGLTFLGLLNTRLLGDDGDDDGTAATGTETGTATATAVGEGDTFLAGTDQTETLAASTLRASGDPWTYEATVRVENTGDSPYELRLGELRLEDGTGAGGADASTGRIEPGESATVTGTWELPPESMPASMTVVAVVFSAGDGGAETVVEDVKLGSPTVRG